jgi:hypothetical protein
MLAKATKDPKALEDSLYSAASKGQEALVGSLLEEIKGADVSQLRWPLLHAALQGHERVVKLLLQHDAILPPGTASDAWAMAAFGRHENVVKLFFKSMKYDYVWAFATTARSGNRDMVDLFRLHGAAFESALYFDPHLLWHLASHQPAIFDQLLYEGAYTPMLYDRKLD